MIWPIGDLKCMAFTADSFSSMAVESVRYCLRSKSRPSTSLTPVSRYQVLVHAEPVEIRLIIRYLTLPAKTPGIAVALRQRAAGLAYRRRHAGGQQLLPDQCIVLSHITIQKMIHQVGLLITGIPVPRIIDLLLHDDGTDDQRDRKRELQHHQHLPWSDQCIRRLEELRQELSQQASSLFAGTFGPFLSTFTGWKEERKKAG